MNPALAEGASLLNRGDRTPDELFADQISLWSLEMRLLLSE